MAKLFQFWFEFVQRIFAAHDISRFLDGLTERWSFRTNMFQFRFKLPPIKGFLARLTKSTLVRLDCWFLKINSQ